MDQNRSTFSTAYIGRWQSTFTNGSASHGFKKEKKEVGKEKRRVTIMNSLCHRKSSNRENKDKKEENSKIKTFQHGRYWQSCKKEKNQWTHKTFWVFNFYVKQKQCLYHDNYRDFAFEIKKLINTFSHCIRGWKIKVKVTPQALWIWIFFFNRKSNLYYTYIFLVSFDFILKMHLCIIHIPILLNSCSPKEIQNCKEKIISSVWRNLQ